MFHPREANILVLEPGAYATKAGSSALVTPQLLTSATCHLPSILTHLGVSISSNTSPLLLIHSSSTTESLVQTAFETLNVPLLHLLHTAVAALYATGVSSGVVIDVGYQSTRVFIVLDAQVVHYATLSINVGGSQIDEYLQQLLGRNGVEVEKEECRRIKEMVGGIAMSGKGAEKWSGEMWVRDDGTSINLGATPSTCMECLFDPTLIGNDGMTLQEAIYYAIQKIDIDKRAVLWDNLCLVGGGSLIKGLKPRLDRELHRLFAISEISHDNQPKDCKFLRIPEYIVAFNEAPNFTSFLGGAIVSRIVFMGGAGYGFITKADYETHGPKVGAIKV